MRETLGHVGLQADALKQRCNLHASFSTGGEPMRQKRLMTLVHLWLIHRFKADAVYYVTPTEDNIYQTDKMKSHGIFTDVHKDVGEIIVADVNKERIEELLAPDHVALERLIRKED